jgi:hypothetical protein
MVIAFDAGDAAYWGLAVFLVLLGVGSAFALYKLGRLFDRVSSFVRGTERDLLPVVVKSGGTVDRVNYQLDKLDTVTDSAVGMAESADTAVRAVSTAISKPVEKVSGLAAGVVHGVSSFKRNRSPSDAFAAAKSAARRREHDLAADLRGTTTPPSAPRPEPTPRPAPQAKPEASPKPAPAPKPPSLTKDGPAAATSPGPADKPGRTSPETASAKDGAASAESPSPSASSVKPDAP